jgi:hypothetical protein
VTEAWFGVLVASAVIVGVGLVALPAVAPSHAHTDHVPMVVSTGLAITVGTLVLLSMASALHPLLLVGLLPIVLAGVGLRLLGFVRWRMSEGATTGGALAAILATAATQLRAAAVPILLVSGLLVLQFLLTAGSMAPWRGFTPYYYWASSLEVAEAAGYPASVTEWGTSVPFLGDYLPFNAAAAGFSMITDGRPPLDMQGFRALVLIVGVSGAFYALRRFFPTSLAAFGVVLVFTSQFLLYKFSGPRPEAFAMGLAGWALWALDVGTVERRPALIGIAALLAALLAASHIPVLLVFVALSACMFACRLMGGRRFRAYTFGFSIAAAGAVAGATVLSAAAQLFRGTTTFLAELFGTGSAMVNNVDQTYVLNVLVRSNLQGPLEESAPSASQLVDVRVFEPWGSQLGMNAVLLLLVSGSLVAFIAVGRRRKRRSILISTDLRLAFPLLVFVGFLLISVLGSLSADTYVPRRTGPDRIAPYLVLAYVLLPLGMASAAGWIVPRRRLLQLIVLGLAVGFVSFTSFTQARELPTRGPTALELAEIERARPALTGGGNGRPLAITNSYTEGMLPTLLEVDGLVDGRIPYTNAPLRERAIEILRATHAFFLSGDCALTDEYRPDYILVTSRPETIGVSRYPIGPRFAQIAREVEPAFDGSFLRVFGYRDFCAGARAAG